VFTARYALSPYIKQIRFVFKGLILSKKTVRLCHNQSFAGHLAVAHRTLFRYFISAGPIAMFKWLRHEIPTLWFKRSGISEENQNLYHSERKGWVRQWNWMLELQAPDSSASTYTCYSAVAGASIASGLPTPRPRLIGP
jgi:hypothetical protein